MAFAAAFAAMAAGFALQVSMARSWSPLVAVRSLRSWTGFQLFVFVVCPFLVRACFMRKDSPSVATMTA